MMAVYDTSPSSYGKRQMNFMNDANDNHDNYSQKRTRFTDDDYEDSSEHVMMEEQNDNRSIKKIRLRERNANIVAPYGNSLFNYGSDSRRMTSLCNDPKHQELLKSYDDLKTKYDEVENSYRISMEENKILKRAVQIQDHKMKDLTNQNHHAGQALEQAFTYIKDLEHINRQLREYFYNQSNPQPSMMNNMPPRPPDIF